MGGGTGIWNTTNSYWAAGVYGSVPYSTWSNTANKAAFFTGTGGTVTLGEAITARALSFDANYTLEGTATLTLTAGGSGGPGPATIQVIDSDDTATISAPISSTVGLAKIGQGTLVLTGTNSLGAIAAAGGTLRLAGSSSTTVSGNVSVGRNWADGALTISGGAGGTLEIQDSAALTAANFRIGDAQYLSGTVNQTGGSVTISGQFRLGHYPNETSTYNLTGGSLVLTGTPTGTVNPSGAAEQPGILYIGVDGTGQFIQTGGQASAHGIVLDSRNNTTGDDTFTLQGGTFTVGPSGIKSGSLDANTSYKINLGGGTLRASGSWASSLNMTLTGTGGNTNIDTNGYDITLSGNITGTSGGISKLGDGTLTLSGATNSMGQLNVAGGNVVFSGSSVTTGVGTIRVGVGTAWVPVGGSGTLTIQDNAAITTSIVMMGENWPTISGMTAVINQTGGTLTITGNSGENAAIRIGHWPDETSIYNLSNGMLNITDPNADLAIATDGTGIFNQTGGEAFAPGVMVNHRNAAGNATFTITGGRFTIGARGIQTAGGPYQINLGGGIDPVLRAAADWASSLNMTLFGAGASAITFDTNGYTITLSGVLSGSGALNKGGLGTLVLTGALNYTGGTMVGGGTLVLAKSDVPFPSAGSTGQFGSAHTVTVPGGTLQLDTNWVTGDGLANKVIVNGGTLHFGSGDNYLGNIELTAGQITTRDSGNPWRTGNWGNGLIKVNASATSSTISGRLCFVGTPSAPKTTFDVADGAAAEDLIVSAVIYDHAGFEGKMVLVKEGPGTMKLTGPLNYTGGTTVNGGVLVLAQPGLGWTTNGQFGSSGHVLTVNAGATLRLTERAILGQGQAHQLVINGGTVEFLHEIYQSKIEMTGGRIVSTPSGSIVHVWRTGNWGDGLITVKASSTSSTIEGRLSFVKTASATKTTFNVEDGPAVQDLVVSANIMDHPGGYEGMELVKAGAGTMVLSGANTYIGPTTVQAGKLLLQGTHTPATVPGIYTVAAGGTLGGTGTTNASVLVQGTLAPGASVGTLHTGSQTWAPAGVYQWEIQDVDAGPGVGWDLADITGSLTISATPASPFVIDVVSLGAGGVPGLVGDFDPLGVYSWEIARTTTGVVGFAPEKFTIELGDFQNYWHGGRWWVSLGNQGNSVFLNYAIPEPASLVLLVLGAAGLLLARCLWGPKKQ